jgi:hypothetical protein
MAIIIRIDVDRPYGRDPAVRHVASRISSDFFLPHVKWLGYLSELKTVLQWLNSYGSRACVFFRRCTLPTDDVMSILAAGGHHIGLHLENSRSYSTFSAELDRLERHTGKKVSSLSKHGSGGRRYGRHHYAPYEPDRYLQWATRRGMRLFLGNLEDPRLAPDTVGQLEIFPSAFWLEPAWRDTVAFPVEWLLEHGQHRDIVLLIHPENVLASHDLSTAFRTLIARLPSRTLRG